MESTEFKKLIGEVFESHTTMKGRSHHTVNELLHCMRYDERLKDFNFNISVIRAGDEYHCIPSIDAFVNIGTLSMWFDDDSIEYEHEFVDDRGYLFYFDCITIRESEVM